MAKNELVSLGLIYHQPMHAYAINAVIKEMNLEHWAKISPASIYNALSRLEKNGSVVDYEVEWKKKAPKFEGLVKEFLEWFNEFFNQMRRYVGELTSLLMGELKKLPKVNQIINKGECQGEKQLFDESKLKQSIELLVSGMNENLIESVVSVKELNKKTKEFSKVFIQVKE